jgi:hypothetical protein
MFIVYKKFYFLKKKAKTIPITSVGNKSLLKQMNKNYNLSFCKNRWHIKWFHNAYTMKRCYDKFLGQFSGDGFT